MPQCIGIGKCAGEAKENIPPDLRRQRSCGKIYPQRDQKKKWGKDEAEVDSPEPGLVLNGREKEAVADQEAGNPSPTWEIFDRAQEEPEQDGNHAGGREGHEHFGSDIPVRQPRQRQEQ
ncbi:MAG: hypothetical protein M3Q86_09700 [Verrucomicrobiota bacterium]|nr:hypothetical protein [Verrucomicrobiota bacterium]